MPRPTVLTGQLPQRAARPAPCSRRVHARAHSAAKHNGTPAAPAPEPVRPAAAAAAGAVPAAPPAAPEAPQQPSPPLVDPSDFVVPTGQLIPVNVQTPPSPADVYRCQGCSKPECQGPAGCASPAYSWRHQQDGYLKQILTAKVGAQLQGWPARVSAQAAGPARRRCAAVAPAHRAAAPATPTSLHRP